MTVNTPRARMSQKRRQAIFTEHCTGHNVAPCCLCGEPIRRHEDRWIIEHKRALALLGPGESELRPSSLQMRPGQDHTQDLPRIRKAKRQQMAGAKKGKPARGFVAPAGYSFDWKLKRYVATV